MSRKGRQPIELPAGVDVKVASDLITVKGPKGTLTQQLVDGVLVKIEDKQILVDVVNSTRRLRSMHGLYRTLIDNMIVGTTKGFEKTLEMVGVGYRAAVQGNFLDLQIGLSHPTKLPIPEGLQVKVDKNVNIIIGGIDKQQVGQYAAEIRAKRPPEPYQGKGIRYKNEYVRRKAGKAAKSAK